MLGAGGKRNTREPTLTWWVQGFFMMNACKLRSQPADATQHQHSRRMQGRHHAWPWLALQAWPGGIDMTVTGNHWTACLTTSTDGVERAIAINRGSGERMRWLPTLISFQANAGRQPQT